MPLELIDRQKEHWALLRQPQRNKPASLAIFVHGFLGDHLTTWGKLPSLLLEHGATEPTLAPWDFLFMGYPTRNVESFLDIARMIATHWDKASRGAVPFTVQYDRLALFGHSLGTLGIRQLLCACTLHPPAMIAALHSVTLFGTPLNGSPYAGIGGLVGGSIADALKPNNPQLRMLRSWNESVYRLLQWKQVRLVLGSDDQVVGNSYADLIEFQGDAKPTRLLNFDHRSLVKPDSWNGSAIRDEVLESLT